MILFDQGVYPCPEHLLNTLTARHARLSLPEGAMILAIVIRSVLGHDGADSNIGKVRLVD